MNKPSPINKESPFTFEELFFSTTDKRGVIRYGNDVFMRISGYPVDQVLGAPHNLIRHPDMPKSVFRLFWNKLKANEPICAFVKNLAADGCFYWVFAFAFPVDDGYLSIRFKPSSAIFEKAKKLYEETQRVEEEADVEAGVNFLLGRLKEEGFETYEDFMIQAAVDELNSRHHKLAGKAHQKVNQQEGNSEISEVADRTSSELQGSFSKVTEFRKANTIILENIGRFKKEFEQLKELSINMKLIATKYGEKAVTLGVISQEFSVLSDKIQAQLSGFSTFAEELTEIIKGCSLSLSALQTQVIMVDFFVKESIHNSSKGAEAFEGMQKNRQSFTFLFSNSIQELVQVLGQLNLQLKQIDKRINEIQRSIGGLEVIRQIGAIESSRDPQVKASFEFHMQGMNNFTQLLRNVIDALRDQRDIMMSHSKDIERSTTGVSGNIATVFDLAMASEEQN